MLAQVLCDGLPLLVRVAVGEGLFEAIKNVVKGVRRLEVSFGIIIKAVGAALFPTPALGQGNGRRSEGGRKSHPL